MYQEAYKDWSYRNIKYDDFVSGKSKQGIEFHNVQLTNVGAGTLGVWVGKTAISLDFEEGLDTIEKKTLKLSKKKK